MIRRLAEALARTSRQVRALEDVVAPALERTIGAIERTLDEREREEHVRFRRLRARRHPAAAPAAGLEPPGTPTTPRAPRSSF
ncbi:MAG: V-type ATP synthase subunit D, partial [Burkholderiales bacterium]